MEMNRYLKIKALTEKVTKSTPTRDVKMPPTNPIKTRTAPCTRPKSRFGKKKNITII